ncbi:hypothetical protein, partial [Staphylococcus aureus]|uniref:hypothetical protein n=1 Tax=Staphylococcus aureus TaxID=1280 RepID=UPI001E2D28B5
GFFLQGGLWVLLGLGWLGLRFFFEFFLHQVVGVGVGPPVFFFFFFVFFLDACWCGVTIGIKMVTRRN